MENNTPEFREIPILQAISQRNVHQNVVSIKSPD